MNFQSPDFARRIPSLAPAYLRFLAAHPTETLIGEVVVLDGFETIEERNDTQEVAEHLPHYIAIGSDSGDYAFLLKTDGGETVYQEEPGNFSHPALEVVHRSFSDWLAGGCPLPEEKPYPIPLHGCLWLLTAPPGGMKDMLRLKKLLGKDWSIPQLKGYLASVPVILEEKSAPIGVHQKLKEYPDLRPLLGFSEQKLGEKHLFSTFADLR
jgi:hypothetical protein